MPGWAERRDALGDGSQQRVALVIGHAPDAALLCLTLRPAGGEVFPIGGFALVSCWSGLRIVIWAVWRPRPEN
jgi:hypothetical protein